MGENFKKGWTYLLKVNKYLYIYNNYRIQILKNK